MIFIIDTIEPLGGFPAVKSEHVAVGELRLDAVLNASAIELAKKASKEYVDDQIATIPKVTKTSQLQNDSGFLTQHQDLSAYAKKTEIPSVPTKLSQLQNDSGYAKTSDIPAPVTKTSQIQNDSGFLTQHQSLTEYAKKSDVPTNISAFTNDAGYLTEHQDINGKANVTDVEDVASRVSTIETEQTALSERMDSFTALQEGSTTGDAELMDIRVGADGTNYDNAGSAVRTQVTNLDTKVNDVNTGIYRHLSTTMTRFKSRNILKNSDFERGLVNNYAIRDSDLYSYVYVDVEPSTQYTFSVANVANSYITFKKGTSWIYDSRIDIMGSEGIKTKTFTTSSETTVLCVCVDNKNKASAQIELGAAATAHEEYYDFYRPYDITELKKGNFDTMEGFINFKTSKNKINPANYQDNKGANWSTITDRAGYCFVDVPTKPNTTYTFSQPSTGNIRIRERLTTDWNWSSTKQNTYPEKNVTITTSSTTDFLRIEIEMKNKSTAQLEIGTVPTAYAPYFEDYYYLNNNVVVEEARESAKLAAAADNKIESINYATENYHAQEEEVIHKVEQAIEENSIVFVMITDVHGTDKLNGYQPTEGYSFNNNYGYYKFRECARVTRKLAENVGADFLINLGDTINSTSDEAYLATDSSVPEVNHVEIKKRFAEFTRLIQGRVPYLYATAHHELYPYGHANALTKGEVYGIANRYTKYFDYKVNAADVRTRGYYYIDIPHKDLRVIVLDSCCWSSNNYSETECDWLRDVALNTNNKVVVFSHMGTTSQTTSMAPDNGALVQSILNDSGKVIAFFHGHTHWDNLILPSESGVDFPIVSLEKAWPTTNKTIPSGIIGSPVSWDRAYDSYSEYCADIVVLNAKTGSFKTFRFGAGEDRQYNP